MDMIKYTLMLIDSGRTKWREQLKITCDNSILWGGGYEAMPNLEELNSIGFIIVHWSIDGNKDNCKRFLDGLFTSKATEGSDKYLNFGRALKNKFGEIPVLILTGGSSNEINEHKIQLNIDQLCCFDYIPTDGELSQERIELIRDFKKSNYRDLNKLCGIPWLLEYSIEILEQCKTPEGFETAKKVFGSYGLADIKNLMNYFQTTMGKNGNYAWVILEPFFKDAQCKFDKLVESVSQNNWSSEHSFEPEYVNLLNDLKNSLFRLVAEGKKIGVS